MKRNLQKFCMLLRYGVLTNMVIKNFIFTLKWQTLSFLGADKLTIATRLLENNLSTMQISSVSPKKKRKISTIIKIHKYFITRRAIYLKENRVAILPFNSIWSYWTGIIAHTDVTLGEQWWRNGESVHLPPMFRVSKDKITYKLCCSRRPNGWIVSRLHSNEFKSSELVPWPTTLYSSQRNPPLKLISFDITCNTQFFISYSKSFLLPPWMGCQSITGLPHSIKFACTHFCNWVERGTVKCFAQKHNTDLPK